MEQLTLTELTEAQFTVLQHETTHRSALKHPKRWLWHELLTGTPHHLRVTTRFSDKCKTAAWVAYLTPLVLPKETLTSLALRWTEGSDWFLIETQTEDAQGVPCHHFIKATVQGNKKYKTHALCVQLDRLSLQE